MHLEIRSGLTPYDAAHRDQLDLLARRQTGTIPDTLLVVEHEPVVTLGRYADDSGLLADEKTLAREGLVLRRIERGGQATYHGPGQVVGYPIIGLRQRGLGVRTYVDRLEAVMIRTAAAFGVDSRRRDGKSGVFCAGGKLGAVGVAVRRGITFHGFAFNVRLDLTPYRFIVPCGLADIPPTSIARERPPGPSVVEARETLVAAFGEVFGVTFVGAGLPDPGDPPTSHHGGHRSTHLAPIVRPPVSVEGPPPNPEVETP